MLSVNQYVLLLSFIINTCQKHLLIFTITADATTHIYEKKDQSLKAKLRHKLITNHIKYKRAQYSKPQNQRQSITIQKHFKLVTKCNM